MKKFQFRLQTALDLRRRREEQASAALAEAQNRENDEAARLNALLAARVEAQTTAAAARTGRVNPMDAGTRERHLDALEGDIVAQGENLALARQETARRRTDAVTAAQETQALEKLRERHVEEHRREEQREEQNFLDELASIRAARFAAA